jgi:cytoskeleton protein RodZ
VETAQDNSASAPATPGEVLAQARERQGLSRTEIAQRLHMSPSQVEALEAGEYARLPKGPFLRGFVRNYAKLLGVDSEPLVASLAEAAPATPRIVVPSQNIRFEPLHERISSSPYVKGGLIAGVVLAFGFAGMYWWTAMRDEPPLAQASRKLEPAPSQIAQAPLPAAETPPPVDAPKMEVPPAAVAPVAPTPAKAEPAKPETPKAVPAAAKPEAPKADVAKADASKSEAPKPAAAPPGSSRLAFTFHGPSWVEVKDGSGKTLMSRVNDAGSDAEVVGKPPFNVTVGNASEVTLRYNGREFPLEPHTRVSVARFTVE